MSGENMSSADNQQETLYYLCGFIVGECSICIIRAKNRRGGTGFYYTPDITISNKDIKLLQRINRILTENKGCISKIKGGFNLSFRGKVKVKLILAFLEKYPPISGDMIKKKLLIIKKAIVILGKKNNRNKRIGNEEIKIELLRKQLKDLKVKGKSDKNFSDKRASQKQIGYFLAGITDAEGSMGFRKTGKRQQPYFCVAMRDEAIINLFVKYFGFGSKYYRPAHKLYQYETGKKENVLHLCHFFLYKCPVQIQRNRRRMQNIQWILND